MAKKEKIQTELNLDNLADSPELNNPITEDLPEATVEKAGYSPSPKVLERLNKMPKPEIKEKYGIDIDELIKTEKRYGVLEALAYGDQTPRPIHIRIPVPGTFAIDTLATVRLKYAFYAENGEAKMFMDNIHRVALKYDVDENGNIIKEASGKPKMVYDRNPIKEGDIIKWGGKELTKEQTDALRLTGHLGEALPDTLRDGTPTQIILSVDPYNNHELIAVDSSSVSKVLKAKPEFKIKGADGESTTFTLTPRQIGDLSLGRSVWLGDKETGTVCVQYNAATRRLERTTDLKSALRKERELKEQNRAAKAEAKTKAENVKVGQKL